MKFYKLLSLTTPAGGRLLHSCCRGLAVTQRKYNRGSFHITSVKSGSRRVFSLGFRFFRPVFCFIMDFQVSERATPTPS